MPSSPGYFQHFQRVFFFWVLIFNCLQKQKFTLVSNSDHFPLKKERPAGIKSLWDVIKIGNHVV